MIKRWFTRPGVTTKQSDSRLANWIKDKLTPAEGEPITGYFRYLYWPMLITTLLMALLLLFHLSLMTTMVYQNYTFLREAMKVGEAVKVSGLGGDGSAILEGGTVIPPGSIKQWVMLPNMAGTIYHTTEGVVGSGVGLEGWWSVSMPWPTLATVAATIATGRWAMRRKRWYRRCWWVLAIITAWVTLLWVSGML